MRIDHHKTKLLFPVLLQHMTLEAKKWKLLPYSDKYIAALKQWGFLQKYIDDIHLQAK
jgi:hypothetical protein